MKLPASAVRFGLAGLATTLLHIAIASVLFRQWEVNASWANAISFAFANLFSYVVNSLWSFGKRIELASWRRFLSVSLVGWLLTFMIARGVEMAGGHFYLGLLAVISIVPVASYCLHRMFTFRSVTT
jgi:putative flippase GtrA